MEQCHCYRDILLQAVEGRDYCIKKRHGASGVAVMAPHGGGIEPGTDIIADAIAGKAHAFYAFNGLLTEGNSRLHISSKRFDEPQALGLAREANTVVTIHGCRDKASLIWVGGLDICLKEEVIAHLQASGFDARLCTRPGMRGIHRSNLCNRGKSGKGLQIEISQLLRHALLPWRPDRQTLQPTQLLHTFVRSARNCLARLIDKTSTPTGENTEFGHQ